MHRFYFNAFFYFVGSLLTIVLFAVNRRLRKRSLFLVFNMAFADLMLGTVTLPIYIYSVGKSFLLWKGGWSISLSICYTIVDTFFSQASLISAAFISGERFYAIYWPFRHRTLSMRAYVVILSTVWALTLVIAALWSTSYFLISYKRAVYVWTPYMLIVIFSICGCNISIWRKFRHGNIASQQKKQRLTKQTLNKDVVVCIYSYFGIVSSFSYFQLFNLCL